MNEITHARRGRAIRIGAILTSGLLCVVISACGGSKPLIKKNPLKQKFADRTRAYFSVTVQGVSSARFGHLNGDGLPDLLTLHAHGDSAPVLRVWVNREGERFVAEARPGWEGQPGDRILQMRLGDLDHDGVADLVLTGKFADGSTAKLLYNNGKGYFYNRNPESLPEVLAGVERVKMADLDKDGHVDLLFSGPAVTGANEKLDPRQLQIMLNDGRGWFRDASELLLPPLRPGITETVIADYDGDAVVDLFLVYGNGRNGLLINNGLGRFADRGHDLLPPIEGESVSADWADFDEDGDNDLLVVNRNIRETDRSFANEYCYMLVNNGHGYFRKGPLKILPRYPAFAVYLLDANGNEIPDIIILSDRGIHFLRGLGNWRFWKESGRRLPANYHFSELTFGDVNDDYYLDIFGITRDTRRGVFWINTFD